VGREGVADGREVEGLEVVRVGEELPREGVERVEEEVRRGLLVRCGVERWDRWGLLRCVVVRWEAERELEVLDVADLWVVRWAGSGWAISTVAGSTMAGSTEAGSIEAGSIVAARAGDPLSPRRVPAALRATRRRARRRGERFRRLGRQVMGFSIGGGGTGTPRRNKWRAGPSPVGPEWQPNGSRGPLTES